MTATIARHPVALAALVVALVHGGPAAAAADKVDEIVVTANKDQTLDLGQASAGSRLGISILDTPASVNVVEGDALRSRIVTSLYKAETQAPGVTSQSTPGNGQGGLAYRGFVGVGSVQILYDGLQLQVGAGTTSFPFDPWTVDRIEVLGGPATVLYGFGGLGGTVNVVSRAPNTMATAGNVELGLGSFKSFRQAVDLTGPLSDRLSYRVDVSHQSSDGYVDRGNSDSLAVSIRVQYQATPTLRLTLSDDFGKNDPMNYWGTPLLNGVFNPAIRRRNFEVLDDPIHFRDNIAQFKQEWTPSDHFSLTNVFYDLDTYRHWKQLTNYVYVPATGLISRTSYREVFHYEQQYGDQINGVAKFAVLGLDNTLSTGAEYEHIKFQTANNTPFGGSSNVDPFNPVPGLFNFGVGTYNQYATRTDHYAVFGEDRLVLLPGLSVVGGVRYDRFDYHFTDLTIGTPVFDKGANFDRVFDPFSWRVGVVYSPVKALSLYAQYATGSDALGNIISTTYPNRNFGLATGRQIEVGAKQIFWGGRAQATVALYEIVKKNLLAPDPTNPTVSIQIGQQSSRGFEGALSLQIMPKLSIEANGTVLHDKFDSFQELVAGALTSRNGNLPPFAAESSANLFVTWDLLRRFEVRGGVQYVGRRFANNANTFVLPSYTIVDAGVRFHVTPRLYADLMADNLFDTDYALTGVNGFSQYLLGPPRSVMFTAGFKF